MATQVEWVQFCHQEKSFQIRQTSGEEAKSKRGAVVAWQPGDNGDDDRNFKILDEDVEKVEKNQTGPTVVVTPVRRKSSSSARCSKNKRQEGRRRLTKSSPYPQQTQADRTRLEIRSIGSDCVVGCYQKSEQRDEEKEAVWWSVLYAIIGSGRGKISE